MDYFEYILLAELILGTAGLSLAIHYFTKPAKMPIFDHLDFYEHHRKTLDAWEPYRILLPKVDKEGNLYFIMPFMFTWAIICGVEHTGYRHRFCYETLRDCISAYDDWEPSLHTEPENFIVRK